MESTTDRVETVYQAQIEKFPVYGVSENNNNNNNNNNIRLFVVDRPQPTHR